jgi:hypothetical protein
MLSRKLRELEATAEINAGEDANMHIHVEFSGESTYQYLRTVLVSAELNTNCGFYGGKKRKTHWSTSGRSLRV